MGRALGAGLETQHGARDAASLEIGERLRGVVTATIDTTRLLRQRWLTGTFGGSIVAKRDIPHFVDLYMNGELDLDALFDAEYPLDEVAKALADLEAGRVTRPVLRF